jgi:hypothetical protein
VSGTKAFTWSRTCGWCTRPRGPPNPRVLAWASVRECHPAIRAGPAGWQGVPRRHHRADRER